MKSFEMSQPQAINVKWLLVPAEISNIYIKLSYAVPLSGTK
jgi:hypothetical protein